MKSPMSSLSYNPFKDLKTELEEKVASPFSDSSQLIQDDRKAPCPEEEYKLFAEAMADVVPILPGKRVEKKNPRVLSAVREKNREEADVICRLRDLVECGRGFIVADTPEYIEGTEWAVHPEITKRLHRGDFSIQDYRDLHGLTVEQAKIMVEQFIMKSIEVGKRAVLIIHGRGRSSPVKPVLKSKVVEWLTQSPLRKWVIAYTSARLCDGGAGATYVLLQQRPLTKRFRKKTARR